MIPEPLTSSLTAEQSPTVLSRINSRRQKGTLWKEGFPWHCGHANGLLPFLSPVLLLCWQSILQNLKYLVISSIECGFLCYCLRLPFSFYFLRAVGKLFIGQQKRPGVFFFPFGKVFWLTEKVVTGAAYFKLLQ